MVLLSFSSVPNQFHSQICELLDSFLAKAKAAGSGHIAAAEEKLQCNWITMVPFIDVFLAPVASHCDLGEPTSSSDDLSTKNMHMAALATELSLSVMMFALSVETSRKCNRELAIQCGLLDFIVSLPWSIPDRWKENGKAIVTMFQKDLHCLPVPRLYSIAAASAAKSGILPFGMPLFPSN